MLQSLPGKDYHIVQNSGRIKLWQINHFRVLARKMLVNLQELKCLPFSYLSESGIWLGKMTFVLPNSPKYSPSRILCYKCLSARLPDTSSYWIGNSTDAFQVFCGMELWCGEGGLNENC